MLLQNDTTMVKERASRILYDNESPTAAAPNMAVNFSEAAQLFSHNHNLEEYNRLAQTEYMDKLSESSVAPQPAPYAAADSVFNPSGFNTNVLNPSGFNPLGLNQTTAEPQYQKYYTAANPVPVEHHTFRPKLVTEFEEYVAPAASTNEAGMEKVLETEVADTSVSADVHESEESLPINSALRLNAKGLIALITFAAVTALIVTLVVINSIAIGDSGSRINKLTAENQAIVSQYNSAMAERDTAYNAGVSDAERQAGSVPDNVKLPQTNNNYTDNSDRNTNLFDQICKLISSIFG